jgi:hypothetical protein
VLLVEDNPDDAALSQRLKMNFWGMVHPESRNSIIEKLIRRVDQDHVTSRYELRILTKQRSTRWLGVTIGTLQPEAELIYAAVFGKAADEFVFTHEDGAQIKDFRWAWWRLCVRAGLGTLSCPQCSKAVSGDSERRCHECHIPVRYSGTIFHDLRRSAVRNMVRSGVPRSVAMRISGHETESVFERYNIGSDADLADAAKRIEEARTTALSSHQTRTKENQSQQTLAN